METKQKLGYKRLRQQFENEKQYPSWDCNLGVKQEYIEWLEQQTAEKDKRIKEMEEQIDVAINKLTEASDIVKQATELHKALSELVHLHMCEQEGLSSGQPTPEMWFEAVEKASEVLNKK